MYSICILLNGIIDPVIYAYAGSFFIYQFQNYKLKGDIDFMTLLVTNFVSKINLATYSKIERFVQPFFQMYFEWVDTMCSTDFKNKLLQQCGEAKSKESPSHLRWRPYLVQTFANYASELPPEELQTHHARVPES